MRSIEDDRTTRAVIRDEALRLFAEHGPETVTVRQIAAAAGVSAGLVVHHFKSKDGLRQEVDRYVLAAFGAMLGELTGPNGEDLLDPGAGGMSLSEVFARHLPADSPLPGYLRRLLLADTEAARELFRRLFELSRAALDDLAAAGLADRGRDPVVRAAFLLANDLSLFLLRDRLTEVVGVDPLSPDGMTRWAPEMLSIYAAGLGAAPQPPPAPPAPDAPQPPAGARDPEAAQRPQRPEDTPGAQRPHRPEHPGEPEPPHQPESSTEPHNPHGPHGPQGPTA
ncbi:TetR/AcrR family transcriptional regulator [Streptomyces sp. MS06]|uniref:TetR/AcrR family transcriptional regulator n=1 Tax=Streptomyces sp. MS06 TaxID=3385974 RepID=UPI00399F9A8F